MGKMFFFHRLDLATRSSSSFFCKHINSKWHPRTFRHQTDLNSIWVWWTLGSVDEFISKALSNRLHIAESRFTSLIKIGHLQIHYPWRKEILHTPVVMRAMAWLTRRRGDTSTAWRRTVPWEPIRVESSRGPVLTMASTRTCIWQGNWTVFRNRHYKVTNLDGILVCEEVNDFKGMGNNADS